MWTRVAAGIGLGLFLTPSLPAASSADDPDVITRQVRSLQVQALQQDILADPQLLTNVLILQGNPAFQRILQDPELLARIKNGDYEALRNDPDLAALADDPLVEALARDLTK